VSCKGRDGVAGLQVGGSRPGPGLALVSHFDAHDILLIEVIGDKSRHETAVHADSVRSLPRPYTEPGHSNFY